MTRVSKRRPVEAIFRPAVFISCFLLFWPALWAQVGTTLISGTIYHADGTAAGGTVLISWPAFSTATGQAIAAGSTSIQIEQGGTVSVSLAPNVGSSPAGSYYTAVYHLESGAVSTEYWVVPAQATATISEIRSSIFPVAQAVQIASKSFVASTIDSAVSAARSASVPLSGGRMTGPLVLSGDPANPLEASTKEYVDAKVAAAGASSGGASYLPLSGGTMTGPLLLAGDPSSSTGAATKNYVDGGLAAINAGLSEKVTLLPAGGQAVSQPGGTTLSVNSLQGMNFASQYQTGAGSNDGIKNVVGNSTNCGLGGSGGVGGCTIVAEPQYATAEQPLNPANTVGLVSGTATIWPNQTHLMDYRGGVAAESFMNPGISAAGVGAAAKLVESVITQPTTALFGSLGTYHEFTEFQISKQLAGGNNFFGNGIPGLNLPQFKSTYSVLAQQQVSYTPGQHLTSPVSNSCYSVGDCEISNLSIVGSGGTRDSGDEGNRVGDTFVSEDTNVFTGTCAGGCTTGSTHLTATATSGAGTQGQERFLLNMNPAKVRAGNCTNANFQDGTGACLTGFTQSVVQGNGPAGNTPTSDVPPGVTVANANLPVSTMFEFCYAGSPTGSCVGGSVVPSGFIPPAANLVAPGTVTVNVASWSGLPAHFCTALQTTNAAGSCYAPPAGVACVADEQWFETVNYTVASNTTVTLLNLTRPHINGGVVSIGGMCGYAIEQTADTYTGLTPNLRRAFPVIGSDTPTHIFYQNQDLGIYNAVLGFNDGNNAYFCSTQNITSMTSSGSSGAQTATLQAASSLTGFNGLTVLIRGVAGGDPNFNGTYTLNVSQSATAATFPFSASTGVAGSGGTMTYCNANWNLYPAVEVASVYNPASGKVDGTLDLAPNAIAWSPGDALEEPHFHSQRVTLTSSQITNFNPQAQIVQGGTGFTLAGIPQGPFFSQGHRNAGAPSLYQGYGGTRTPPSGILQTAGVWNYFASLHEGPNIGLFNVGCKAAPIGCGSAANSAYNLFSLADSFSGGGTSILFDPSARSLAFNFANGNSYRLSPLTANFPSLSAGSMNYTGASLQFNGQTVSAPAGAGQMITSSGAVFQGPVVSPQTNTDYTPPPNSDLSTVLAAAIATGSTQTIRLSSTGTYVSPVALSLPANSSQCINILGDGRGTPTVRYTGTAALTGAFLNHGYGTVNAGRCTLDSITLDANGKGPALLIDNVHDWTVGEIVGQNCAGTSPCIQIGSGNVSAAITQSKFSDLLARGNTAWTQGATFGTTVTGGVLTGLTVTNGGVGYQGATVYVFGCTVAPVVTVSISGGAVTTPVIASGGSGCGASPTVYASDVGTSQYGIQVGTDVSDSDFYVLKAGQIGTSAAIDIEGSHNRFFSMHPFVGQPVGLLVNGSANLVYGTECDSHLQWCAYINGGQNHLFGTSQYWNLTLENFPGSGSFYFTPNAQQGKVLGLACRNQQLVGGYVAMSFGGGAQQFPYAYEDVDVPIGCDGVATNSFVMRNVKFGGNVGSNARYSFGSNAGSTGFGTAWFENQGTGNPNPTTVFRCGISQTGSDVVFANQTSSNVASIDCNGNFRMAHIIGGTGTPTVAAGAAAGTGPAISVAGTDTAGTISLTAGASGTTAGTIATLTFSTAFGTAPYCNVTIHPLTAAIGQDWTTTTGTLVVTDTSALAAGASLKLSYSCSQ